MGVFFCLSIAILATSNNFDVFVRLFVASCLIFCLIHSVHLGSIVKPSLLMLPWLFDVVSNVMAFFATIVTQSFHWENSYWMLLHVCVCKWWSGVIQMLVLIPP